MMGKGRTNKYRKRRNPRNNSASYGQRRRRERELSEKLLKQSKLLAENNEVSGSINELPVISAVHGKDYFTKNQFCETQTADESTSNLETTIKSEPCEAEIDLSTDFNNSNAGVKMLQPHYLNNSKDTQMQSTNEIKNHSIPSKESCDSNNVLHHSKTHEFTEDKERQLLIDIIKYLDDCAKIDKFDLAGKMYAAKLRTVIFTNQQAMAENLCRQVLLEAEHFNLDEKIILMKQPLNDCNNNRKNRFSDISRSDLGQSLFLHLKKDSLFQNIQKRLLENNRQDRFDKFGKFYASKMRSFSESQYFYADKLINEIVLEAELGRLRANYKLAKLGDIGQRPMQQSKTYIKKNLERRTIATILSSNTTSTSEKNVSQPQKSSMTSLSKTIARKHFSEEHTNEKASIDTVDKRSKYFKQFQSGITATAASNVPELLSFSSPSKKSLEMSNSKIATKSANKYVKNTATNNSSLELPLTTPNLTSIQNSGHQHLLIPNASPNNKCLEMSNSKIVYKSANKYVKNSATNNSSLELPLTPPNLTLIQNSGHQLLLMPNTSPINVLRLLSFNQSCQLKWTG